MKPGDRLRKLNAESFQDIFWRSFANNQKHTEGERRGLESDTWPSAGVGKELTLSRYNRNLFRRYERAQVAAACQNKQRCTLAEEWDILLAGSPNPEFPVPHSSTAEVCSAGSQKGLKPLGFTHIRRYNAWTADRDVLEWVGLHCFCTASHRNNSFHFHELIAIDLFRPERSWAYQAQVDCMVLPGKVVKSLISTGIYIFMYICECAFNFFV